MPKVNRDARLFQTAMDVMAEMEEKGLLSQENMDLLITILEECDSQLVKIIHREGNSNGYQENSLQNELTPELGKLTPENSLHREGKLTLKKRKTHPGEKENSPRG